MAEALTRCQVCKRLHKPHCGNALPQEVTHTSNARAESMIDGCVHSAPLTNAQKQRAYRARHADKVKAANAARMRAKRAAKP